MDKTVVGLFDTLNQAQQTVKDLVDSGFRHEDISLVANDTSNEYAGYLNEGTMATHDVTANEGAGFGAVVGALTGALVGLTALTIPGLGPVLAAGPLLAAFTGGTVGAVAGAATGGIVAGLVKTGITDEDSQYYAEGVRRGGTLVIAHTVEDMAQRASDIMNRHGAVDIVQRVEDWRRTGWTGFNADAGPYTPTRSQAMMQTANWDTYTNDFRTHYNTHFGNQGRYTYEQYLPAYRYGYQLANNQSYKDWNSIESDVHTRWEERNKGTWEDFKDAIRYAWNKVRGVDTARQGR